MTGRPGVGRLSGGLGAVAAAATPRRGRSTAPGAQRRRLTGRTGAPPGGDGLVACALEDQAPLGAAARRRRAAGRGGARPRRGHTGRPGRDAGVRRAHRRARRRQRRLHRHLRPAAPAQDHEPGRRDPVGPPAAADVRLRPGGGLRRVGAGLRHRRRHVRLRGQRAHRRPHGPRRGRARTARRPPGLGRGGGLPPRPPRHARPPGRGRGDERGDRQRVQRQPFATAAIARLHLDTGQLRWVNAGHPDPLIVRDGALFHPGPCKPHPPLDCS